MSDSEKPLKAVIERFLELYKFDKKFEEIDVVNAYKEAMGKMIVSKTDSIWYKKGTLQIRLTSAVLKQELSMNKSKIASIINEKIGKEVITSVIIK